MSVRFRVTDFEDKPVVLPACLLEVPAQTSLQHEVQLPSDWRGFYQVTASVQPGGTSVAAPIRLAIVPLRASQDSVCGINHAFVTPDLIQSAAKAGVSWYRDWSLKWQHMEPAKGTYHWELADAQIDRVLRQGCSVLPLLPPFPSADWSSEAPSGLAASGYPGVRARQAWAPKDPQELADFIEHAVSRYQDRIHIWEFLNEPIYTDYALPARLSRPSGAKPYGPADYVALLEIASAAMRSADPACKIIGGIAGGPRELTREVLDAGILKYVNLFNLHIYPGLRAPEAYAGEMTELLKDMEAHGGQKPIWITEFSYYGVEKIFIHSGASGTVNRPNFECALFDYGGAPRKLAPALAVLTHVLGPSAKCVGAKAAGNAGWVAAFETGSQAVLALWQAEDEHSPELALPSAKDLTWMDAMGRKLPGPPLRLSTSLTYLLARSGSAAALLSRIAR